VSNGERSQNPDLKVDDNSPSKTQGKKKVDEVDIVRRPYNYYSAIYLQLSFSWQANVKASRPKKLQDSEKAAKVTSCLCSNDPSAD
jgi:hypothetical protein